MAEVAHFLGQPGDGAAPGLAPEDVVAERLRVDRLGVALDPGTFVDERCGVHGTDFVLAHSRTRGVVIAAGEKVHDLRVRCCPASSNTCLCVRYTQGFNFFFGSLIPRAGFSRMRRPAQRCRGETRTPYARMTVTARRSLVIAVTHVRTSL